MWLRFHKAEANAQLEAGIGILSQMYDKDGFKDADWEDENATSGLE